MLLTRSCTPLPAQSLPLHCYWAPPHTHDAHNARTTVHYPIQSRISGPQSWADGTTRPPLTHSRRPLQGEPVKKYDVTLVVADLNNTEMSKNHMEHYASTITFIHLVLLAGLLAKRNRRASASNTKNRHHHL